MTSLRSIIKRIPDAANVVVKFRENDSRIRATRKSIDMALMRGPARNREFLRESESFMKRHFNGYADVRWHLLYASLSGILSPGYVPYDLWNTTIEPQLNPPDLARTYVDKNFYDKLFAYHHLPRTWARFYNQRFHDARYDPVDVSDLVRGLPDDVDRIVMKPSLVSGGGRGIRVLTRSEFASIVRSPSLSGNWIFQEYVQQHPALAAFHPASLNTVRIMTLDVDGECRMLMAELKMGAGNNIVDNVGAGGLFVGLDPRGQLKPYGLDQEYRKHTRHPDTGIAFDGTSVPGFDRVRELVTKLHRFLYNFRVVSWDVAVTPDLAPVVIEYNLFQQTLDMQFNDGPLFGSLTDQILARIRVPSHVNRFGSALFALPRRVSLRNMQRI